MNILTISDSPFLITRNARINRDICRSLSKNGHNVSSLVFNHEKYYFLPDSNNQFYFENIKIFPYDDNINKHLFIYQTMKKCQPHIVINIGHYEETNFIYNIKMLYPNLFKWISIITSGSKYINEKCKDPLKYVDNIITLNTDTYNGIKNIVPVKTDLIHYGSDDTFFDKYEERNGILSVCKNSKISNMSSFLLAINKEQSEIHYNINDKGFYDVPLLRKRFNIDKSLKLPEKFISVRDGITDSEMNSLYNKYSIFIDHSMQSSTSISMIESMMTGCFPIGVNTGASKDILSNLPDEYRFIVDGEEYIGENEESFFMVNIAKMGKIIQNILKSQLNKEWEKKGRNIIKCYAKKISKENFLININRIIQDIVISKNAIVVDSL